MVTLKIEFDNEDAALHFMRWLCGSGEQWYWEWMENREQEDDGPITAVKFDYWDGTKQGKNFGRGLVIHTKCGRLERG